MTKLFRSSPGQLAKLVSAFAAVYVIWGSTYLAIRFAVDSMPPFLMIGLRFLIGGLAFYAYDRFRHSQRPSLRQWWQAFLVGSLMVCGGTGLVAWAELTVPSGLTALLVGIMPLWIVLLDWARNRARRPSAVTGVGIALGIAGVTLLVAPWGMGGYQVNLIGASAVLLAALFWAHGSLLSRSVDLPKLPFMGFGMQMIAGSVSLLVVGSLRGELTSLDIQSISTSSWLAFAYLTTLGGVAFAAYLWLLKNTEPAKAATYAFINPAVALFLGVVLANEPIDLRSLAAALIIIAAVAIIIRQKNQPAESAVASDQPTEPIQIDVPVPCPASGRSH